MELRAFVERDYVAAQAGLLKRFLLDGVHDRPAGGFGIRRRHLRFHRGFHAIGDVFNLLKHIELHVDALEFLLARRRIEPVGDEIMAGAGEFLHGVGADVVVGDDQAVGRDEGTGAAGVEAHGGVHQVVQPIIRRVELVSLFEEAARGVVEEPHAFVGAGGERDE